ncbi:MAG TPA: hypothetical protein VGV39_07605 [Mesorhizobium sp.]|jgi:hypothetical protein|uniref:hypothetical protein n=1 Tax=Mesorhizobium sp. TaxID=1871066 RepID=UPI002DDCA197|nr:hypothetical protein [Mesorhizobium sp.]HEV2502925.1 hypothetical protein [Mesorhizobium sp.]
MRKILTLSTLAVALALTSLPLTTASAEDLNIQIGPDGPKVMMRDRRCDPDRENCGDRRRSDEWRSEDDGYGRRRPDEWRSDRNDPDEFSDRRRECSPDRALDKAERMGVRRARVVGVGRRTIEVRGIARSGERVRLIFGRRDPRCPLMS